ncbi:MAG: hypothetical protein QF790_10090 [Gammaproteobacteria bacterium]|jgi:hypothetical protein|nr:hypothetical protein [Gammaproteobacteria bacterium]MDP6617501.1 hypothetical protein [Gammaproteobacteria bacterium]MDP6695938.1 hypothetical protein [Gammaproteobacteria bacterium]
MIDEKSRSVTSLFMLLAILVMAALAYSVSQRSDDSEGAFAPLGAALMLAKWLDRSFPEFTVNQIHRVSVTYPDGETVRFARASTDDPGFQINDTVLDKLAASALLETVGEIPDDAELTGSTPLTVSFETFDGLNIEIDVYGRKDSSLLHVAASAPDKAAETDAQTINARTSGRLYQVAGYRLNPPYRE